MCRYMKTTNNIRITVRIYRSVLWNSRMYQVRTLKQKRMETIASRLSLSLSFRIKLSRLKSLQKLIRKNRSASGDIINVVVNIVLMDLEIIDMCISMNHSEYVLLLKHIQEQKKTKCFVILCEIIMCVNVYDQYTDICRI